MTVEEIRNMLSSATTSEPQPTADTVSTDAETGQEAINPALAAAIKSFVPKKTVAEYGARREEIIAALEHRLRAGNNKPIAYDGVAAIAHKMLASAYRQRVGMSWNPEERAVLLLLIPTHKKAGSQEDIILPAGLIATIEHRQTNATLNSPIETVLAKVLGKLSQEALSRFHVFSGQRG
jgi:hypothetical protein